MNITLIQFLLQIKNTTRLKKTYFLIKKTKEACALAKVFYKEGLIQGFSIKNFLVIFLRYYLNLPVLNSLKIVSTPSLKTCLSFQSLCKIKEKFTVLFISTKKGILTSIECKKQKLGGHLLFIC